MKIKLSRSTILPLIILWYLFIGEIFKLDYAIAQYADEIICVFFVIYILANIRKKKKQLPKENLAILIGILLLFVLGILSSVNSSMSQSIKAMVLDVVLNFKPYICFVGFYLMTTERNVLEICNSLLPISKLLMIIGTMCGVLSLFVDMGMSGGERYGISSFFFIWKFCHIYSMMTLFFLLVITISEKNIVQKNLFWILAIIQLLFTTKGVSVICAIAMGVFLYYFRKHRRVNVILIAFLFMIALGAGHFQLENYLMNSSAPRYLLYQYGAITANEYFPFGAGYATYGSNMAMQYYSELYIKYKFPILIKDEYLSDNYWPMIIGEFGWIGLTIMLVIVWCVFRQIQVQKNTRLMKAMMFTLFAYIMVGSIGSSTPVTSAGVLLFMGIVMLLKVNLVEEVCDE